MAGTTTAGTWAGHRAALTRPASRECLMRGYLHPESTIATIMLRACSTRFSRRASAGVACADTAQDKRSGACCALDRPARDTRSLRLRGGLYLPRVRKYVTDSALTHVGVN